MNGLEVAAVLFLGCSLIVQTARLEVMRMERDQARAAAQLERDERLLALALYREATADEGGGQEL